MEMRLQKTVLAALLGLAGVAHAGAFVPPAAPASCPNVTVPCERTGWELGFTAWFNQPTGDDLYYGSEFNVNSNTIAHQIDADKYKFGWEIAGRYWWGTGNFAAVDYHDFDKHYSNSFDFIDNNEDAVTDFGRLDVHHQRANVGIGKQMLLGSDVSLGVEFGAQWQRLDTKLGFIQETEGDATTVSRDEGYKTKFNGYGPQAAVHFAWTIANNVSLVGTARGALVIGDVHSQYKNFLAESSVTNTKTTSVIPTADMKLGLRYGYAMGGYGVNVEAGYRVEALFNSVVRSDSVILPIFAAGRNFVSDYGQHGPYVSLSVAG